LVLVLSCACSAPPKAQTNEADLVRTPTAESDPSVVLNISVGIVSGRVLFENKSGETLRNILVVMTEESGGNEFRHTIGMVPALAMMHFLPRVFATPGGTPLDPAVHKVKTITVYADISTGRGRWYGSY
jgi:hypothetical protein